MNKNKLSVTLKKTTAPVLDTETKLRCIALVAKLESVQEDLDALEDVSIVKGGLKKATKEVQQAIAPIIANWYKQNITAEEGQQHFGTLGKQYEAAIKAVTNMHMGMWMCVPDLVAEPKALPAEKAKEVKEKVALFFLACQAEVGEEMQTYLIKLIESAMCDYLANPAHETPTQIAERVFTYYYYTMRNLPTGEYVQAFGELFNGYKYE